MKHAISSAGSPTRSGALHHQFRPCTMLQQLVAAHTAIARLRRRSFVEEREREGETCTETACQSLRGGAAARAASASVVSGACCCVGLLVVGWASREVEEREALP